MPRQAAAAGFGTTTRQLIQPPANLNEAERNQFIDIVLGVRPDHFVPSDIPLLARYARALVREQIAADALAADGYITADGKPSGWLQLWQASIRATTTLARMLSLSPGGRVAKTTKESEPVSYYEKMRLERRDDDAAN